MERQAVTGWDAGNVVSIPERVWGGLEQTAVSQLNHCGSAFQSLRGFGVGWSPIRLAWQSFWVVVSIPERVWGGLEPGWAILPRAIAAVSIPERVWGGLERGLLPGPRSSTSFQSLRGFGVGWSNTNDTVENGYTPFQSLRGFGVGWSLKPNS